VEERVRLKQIGSKRRRTLRELRELYFLNGSAKLFVESQLFERQLGQTQSFNSQNLHR
jgi:hypothetical protein